MTYCTLWDLLITMYNRVKTDSEILAMRESGKMLATVLEVLSQKVSINMSTKDLAEIAKTELKSLGGQPTFLGYNDFPDVLCVSLNDEIVHGIPRSDKFIKNGDLVSMDFGVTYKGMITDSAITVVVGEAPKELINLVNTTKESLIAGINVINGKIKIGDISAKIQSVLDKDKLGIVRDLVGHGVGHELHEEPNIANFGTKGSGAFLEPGMTIAIEPMATLGSHKIKTDNDGWTIRTLDGSYSAHFEHTVLVTQVGSEILTKI